MGSYLGVLFCGGRGQRLGEITRFVSKSFVPIYDRPVYRFGLDLLEKSTRVTDILILTNSDNDAQLNQLGYPTLIQNDDLVYDMFSGWEYIKKQTGTSLNGVLVPSDNITDMNMDHLIEAFEQQNSGVAFSTVVIDNPEKLSQMGCYDPALRKFHYKHADPPTNLGVIAPYVIRNTLAVTSGDEILGHSSGLAVPHKGYWFDVGDPDTLLNASNFIAGRVKNDVSV